MSTLQSIVVDNLSEIYKKERKGCKERKNTKSVCNFIGLKNNMNAKTVKKDGPNQLMD